MQTPIRSLDGWGTWFGDYDEVAYGDLDLDADAELSEDEYATGLADAGIYHDWAGDGEFGEAEFVTGLYDVYDADDDLVITQAEYDERRGVLDGGRCCGGYA